MKDMLSMEFCTDKMGQAFQLSTNHVKRDALISTLLQDRGTLRLICAPHGFGKTELAREYALRLFHGMKVVWLDGDTPDFLLSLDSEEACDVLRLEGGPDLVILDNLPWLHEGRAQTLSRQIDKALYAGVEVIVTSLPSCDCLSSLQPDRLTVHADEMLVTNQECAPQWDTGSNDGRAFGTKRWKEAGKSLFGLTPLVMWNTETKGQLACLRGLFSECIPPSVLKGMLAMLLLEHGAIDELARVGISLKADEVAMLSIDYPIFGIDSVSGSFEVQQFALQDLKAALVANKLESLVLEGRLPLPERVLGIVFERGESRRGAQIIEAFCSDERCAGWLMEQGWGFLDAGKLELVSKLFERCPEQAYVQSPVLQSMHAWLSGLSGDRREACHIARHVLAYSPSPGVSNAAGVAARIALAMFSEDSLLVPDSCPYSSPDGPIDAVDFLASIVDCCTNVELARAFRLESARENPQHEKARKPPTKSRAKTLERLFTEHAGRFCDTRAFRLALHLLSHVDSVSLRRLVQDLGCEIVIGIRRSDLTSFSEALIVRDMWQTGYFGLVGPVMDRRDAKVLDGAAHMLSLLAQYSGNETAFIPWEIKGISPLDEDRAIKPGLAISQDDQMRVRLFGSFEVMIGDRYASEGKWRKKARALIAILVLNQGRDVPRDEIFSQIWPNASHIHAMDNFYTAWSNCTSLLGELPYLERNGEYCRINTRYVHSDVGEFEQLTRHLLTSDKDSSYLLDTYAKIEAIYRGSLMPGETGIKIINVQRERFRSLYVDAMVAASECALQVNDVRVGLWFARKAMDEDQTREDVYRTLMKAQMAAGQRCPAIKTFFDCRDYLRSTLGLDPSFETRELYNLLVTTDPELLRLDSSSFPSVT